MVGLEENTYDDSFIDLRIIQSGSEQCRPAHSFGPATREHYLFHYVLRGEGVLYGSSREGELQKFSVHEGQGFLIYPDQINTYVADSESPWEYVWIEFDGLRVKENLDATDLSCAAPIYEAKSDAMRDDMVEEMRYIVSHGKSPILHTMGHLYLFFDYFTRSAESAKRAASELSGVHDAYVSKVISYIEQHYAEDLTVEKLAAVCGIDRSHLGKTFRDAVGKSPRSFLREFRMAQAASLLRSTDLTVSEVAKRVGYDNPLHFSRAFKDVEGKSPTEWRSAHSSSTR